MASTAPETEGSKWVSRLGSVVLFVVVVLAFRACGGAAGKKAAEARIASMRAQEQLQKAQSGPFSDLVSTACAGLALKLPKELTSLIAELDSGGELERFEKHTALSTTRSCIIKHFVFKAPRTVSAAEGAEMTENDFKKDTKYKASRRAHDTAGVDGLILDLSYEKLGATVEQSILYLSRGGELWEVHLFGIGDPNPTSVKEMKDKVFSSVKIRN